MSIHARDEQVILQFGLKKPAFRIVVNTPTTHGSIGLTTGLDPSMTLGCGGYGGNITSDNITPRHLLNIKRLAYELRPLKVATSQTTEPARAAMPLPRTASVPATHELDASTMRDHVSSYLDGRQAPPPVPSPDPGQPVSFVCEDDVKEALKADRKIVVGERTIITPSARDLGESKRVFVPAGWKR
jgi:acetaldehyde dehydrogenase (acetylating)